MSGQYNSQGGALKLLTSASTAPGLRDVDLRYQGALPADATALLHGLSLRRLCLVLKPTGNNGSADFGLECLSTPAKHFSRFYAGEIFIDARALNKISDDDDALSSSLASTNSLSPDGEFYQRIKAIPALAVFSSHETTKTFQKQNTAAAPFNNRYHRFQPYST